MSHHDDPLHQHPDVLHARSSLERGRRDWDRHSHTSGHDEVLALIARMDTALRADPTLALDPVATMNMDLALHHSRHLVSLGRALDTAPTPQDPEHLHRARAEQPVLVERTAQVVAEVEGRVNADWHRPDQRRSLARRRLPDPATVTAALEQVRSLCAAATEVDPDLPEVRRVADLAEEIARTLAAGPVRTCAAPRCSRPLPEEEAEPGRERRYCSPACRRRAKR